MTSIKKKIDFSLHRNFETRSGAKLVSYSMDAGVNFSKEKVAGLCEVNHSIPSRVNVKNECSCTHTPTSGFMVCALTTLLFLLLKVLNARIAQRQRYLSTAMETLIPVAGRSKAKVCDRSFAGTAGSNIHIGTGDCLYYMLCFVR